MKLWQDLFGTDYGLMSISGLLFIVFMAFWFVRFFLRKMAEPPPKIQAFLTSSARTVCASSYLLNSNQPTDSAS